MFKYFKRMGVIIFALVALAALSAGAASACNSGWSRNNNGLGSYFLGADAPGSMPNNTNECIDGTDSLIYNNNPTVNTASGNFSSSWVGIYDLYNGRSNPNNYVLFQDGYGKVWTGERYGFWQTNVDGQEDVSGSSSIPNNSIPDPPVGSYTDYKVLYSGGAAHFWIAGVNWANVPYTTHGEWNGTCYYATVRSEIPNSSNQEDGTVGTPEVFSELQTREFAGSNYQNAAWTYADPTWDIQAWNVPGTVNFPIRSNPLGHGNPNGIFVEGVVGQDPHSGHYVESSYDTCGTNAG